MSNMSSWYFENDSLIDQMNPVSKENSRDRNLLERMHNHKHMIETIERFEWKGLPPEIPCDLIERVLYFRFKGALFNFNDRFVFLPFTLKGKDSDTIDSYGRYFNLVPVLFTGQWRMGGDGEIGKDIDFVSNLSYQAIYDLPTDQENEVTAGTEEDNEDIEPKEKTDQKIEGEVTSDEKIDDTKAVILTDSTLEISQDYTPMAYLIRPLMEQLTDILVLVNMDLINSAKVFYVIAKDESQKEAIEQEFANLDRKILNGKRVVVVTSPTKLEELNGNSSKDSARYFQSYQSIDNLRKDIIGSDNGGTFMKQEHTTEMETETNSNQSNGGSPVLNNALRMRQDFCTIANKVFGLNMSVDIKGGSESKIVEDKGSQTEDREGDDE